MPNRTFNAAVDFFNLGSNTSLKLVSSSENRSIQTAQGPNTYGDATVVDSFGLAAAPSCDYKVVGTLQHTNGTPLFRLGAVVATPGIVLSGSTASPVVVGTLSIATQNGSEPRITVSGQTVQVGATAPLRTYIVPRFYLSPRHRAQDMLYGASVSETLCTIKKGDAAADPTVDYGLASVNATFPIAFTFAQPQGVLVNYDLHGETATVAYVMNWYADGEPTIEAMPTLTLGTNTAPITVNTTMSTPVGRANPENGYTQYTWQVSFPLVGIEGAGTQAQAAAPSASPTSTTGNETSGDDR